MFVCTSRRNPTREFAVKLIKKEDVAIDESKFAEEMAILATIRHRNIIRLRDVYETPTEIAIVTELAYGGELFDRILKVRSFSEKEVAKIAFKLFHAIAYLHSRGIVHRESGTASHRGSNQRDRALRAPRCPCVLTHSIVHYVSTV